MSDGVSRQPGTLGDLAPITLTQIKHTLAIVENTDITSGMQAESQACAVCFSSEHKKEGMEAFIAKRPAAFKWPELSSEVPDLFNEPYLLRTEE